MGGENATKRGVRGSAQHRKENAMSANIDCGPHAPQHAEGRRVVAPIRLRTLWLLVTLTLSIVAPGLAEAQRAAHMPQVAFLDPGSPSSPTVCSLGFRQGL